MSADPLAVHAPGEADINLYAYVSGKALRSIDPIGLQEMVNDQKSGSLRQFAQGVVRGAVGAFVDAAEGTVNTLTPAGDTPPRVGDATQPTLDASGAKPNVPMSEAGQAGFVTGYLAASAVMIWSTVRGLRTSAPPRASPAAAPKSTPDAAVEAPTAGPPGRPTWKQSEGDIGDVLDSVGARRQVSFKEGKEVRYGTKGSTRPEAYSKDLRTSFEVKNYDLSKPGGVTRFLRNVKEQSASRAASLPKGTRQTLIVDVRGQKVPQHVLDRLPSRVQRGTRGRIQAEDVYIFTSAD